MELGKKKRRQTKSYVCIAATLMTIREEDSDLDPEVGIFDRSFRDDVVTPLPSRSRRKGSHFRKFESGMKTSGMKTSGMKTEKGGEVRRGEVDPFACSTDPRGVLLPSHRCVDTRGRLGSQSFGGLLELWVAVARSVLFVAPTSR
jgi:hypothetical protein